MHCVLLWSGLSIAHLTDKTTEALELIGLRHLTKLVSGRGGILTQTVCLRGLNEEVDRNEEGFSVPWVENLRGVSLQPPASFPVVWSLDLTMCRSSV